MAGRTVTALMGTAPPAGLPPHRGRGEARRGGLTGLALVLFLHLVAGFGSAAGFGRRLAHRVFGARPGGAITVSETASGLGCDERMPSRLDRWARRLAFASGRWAGGQAAMSEGMAGSGMAGSGMAGSGMAGSGMPGSGMPGSGMPGSGMPGIVAWLRRDGSGGLADVAARLCADILGMTGIAVSVLAVEGVGELVWRTDGTSVGLDNLQFTLGEGPSQDAGASGELVLEPDLAAVPVQRWPVFTPAALELGVRAVFAVPLQIGAIRIGVLLAHRDEPGPLAGRTLADLLAFAQAATDALLGSAIGASEPRWLADQPPGYRAEVHQATGMISAQLGVGQAEALVRMRAYAFSHQRAVAEVAADVVGRRLRLDEDPGLSTCRRTRSRPRLPGCGNRLWMIAEEL